MSTTSDKKHSILIINPNSSASMSESLIPLVQSLNYENTTYTFFTADPASQMPASINSPADAVISADACIPQLLPLLDTHDAFLVACYSVHPLVGLLKARPEVLAACPPKPVTGIFEASLAAALLAVGEEERVGIVTTGKVWEESLTAGAAAVLGGGARFAGVESTGLTAGELHAVGLEVAREKMMEATKRLLRRGAVGAVCLGCAAMAGLGECVRAACVEELGLEKGRRVRVVDGVLAGVGFLQNALRAGI